MCSLCQLGPFSLAQSHLFRGRLFSLLTLANISIKIFEHKIIIHPQKVNRDWKTHEVSH